MKKFLPWFAVLLWMLVIFYFSHQPATLSNQLSSSITEELIELVDKIVPVSDSKLESVNNLVRKNAHFIIYFVLGMFVAFGLRTIGFQGNRLVKFALLICVLYAVSDEVHQYFVDGRGPQVKDVLIDSAGAIIGISLFCFVDWLVKKSGKL